jgi:hypothetical protein
MMIAPTEILFFRWVTLTEQKWVTFRERRRNTKDFEGIGAATINPRETKGAVPGPSLAA